MPKEKKKLNLGIKVIIGLILGLAVGYFSKQFGLKLEILGKAFIQLIQMVIVPLVFPLIVLGIASMHDTKKLGRIAFKTLLYFEIVTTFLIILGIVLAKVTNVGGSMNVGQVDTASLGNLAKGIDFGEFFLSIIPSNVVDAMAQGKLLPIIFFGIFVGLALTSLEEKAKPVLTFFEAWLQAMFKVVEYAVSFAPIGVFGFIAFSVAKYGIHSLLSLGHFVGIVYLSFFITAFIVFPLIALIFRIPYIELLRRTGDLVLLTFTTRSSEASMPLLIKRLGSFGVSRSITSFVLPTGYSFNLDGASIYISVAIVFLANVYNLPLSLEQIVVIIGLLMLMTKGLAGVPSAVIVVLLAAAKEIGLPAEGVALLLAVDFFVDMGRSALNVVGNSLATVVIAKSEDSFYYKKKTNDSYSAPTDY